MPSYSQMITTVWPTLFNESLPNILRRERCQGCRSFQQLVGVLADRVDRDARVDDELDFDTAKIDLYSI
ncbi:hypothetical protein BpHYR1_039918 [Brachionus plicatilis]|uniref:Uncharacterized protein n=1 Tax=Brachionus plicatilis TaxID=10195 RepID=A0A3M7QC57_BRAPC|nr:hypothetical protein BpHYR1_039918 [Brachionus plicatilis]